MALRYILVMISCIYETNSYQVHVIQKYNTWYSSAAAPQRLIEIMTMYTEEARQRIQELNLQRFMYEESPQYEQGYVIGEIIERFQKVVNHAQRPTRYISDNFFNALKRTELIQILYFEIYHLVRIMQEIPQKYKSNAEHGTNGKGSTMVELLAAQKQIADLQKRRAKEKRRRRKLNAKLREMYLKGINNTEYGKSKKPYKPLWPYDYGWEIDYLW